MEMADGTKFARKNVMDLPPYIPGKPIEAVEREYGVHNAIKMASNENPLHTSPKAIAAMQQELENCYLYPEGSSPLLREKLAAKYRVSPEQIIVGDGGEHIIILACNAFINEGDETIVCEPTFASYNIYTRLMGGKLIELSVDKEYRFDVDAVLAAITPKTKMIFLCNPNNPTSTIIGKKKMQKLMDNIPDHVVVLLDEAYFEFVSDPDYPDGMDYVRAGKNVIVLRTFSKAYGLAGLRIGYAVAPLHLAEALGRVIPAFPVTRLSQVAAYAAMDDEEFLTRVIANNEEGRTYLQQQLKEMGMECAPSSSNFIFVNIGMPSREINEELLRQGVIVRPGFLFNCPEFLRVSIGTMEENQRFISALRKIKAEYDAK